MRWFRKHWIVLTVVAVVVSAALVIVTLRFGVPGQKSVAGEDESGLPAMKEAAPPDLEKLREPYAAGLKALKDENGAEAIQRLSSFDFGPRVVEEYRLYHLARAYALAKKGNEERLTLARLWRRQPKLVAGNEAMLKLASLYSDSGDFHSSSGVYASLAREGNDPAVVAASRWNGVGARLATGDVAGALFAARNIVIHHPRAKEADDAQAIVRALTGIPPTQALPLTPSERLERAIALMQANDAQTALEELTVLEKAAPPGLKPEVQLQRGVALHRLRRFEDSNKALEPLTAGAFKVAIPALQTTARNYAIVSSAINPNVTKVVKERKKVGTTKVRVGKGKKRRTVTKPKYANVNKTVKLVDLAKKRKKDEYERLASERLKDLLQLKIEPSLRLQVLETLITRASAKNQDAYLMELIPQVVKLDRSADPGLQHFWDKAWAAYARGDLATARKLLRFIADTYTHPNVRRQSEYWYARTIERQGSKEEATAIYRKLAAAPYADLYALHSVARGAPRQETKSNPFEKEGPDWAEIAEKEMPAELRLAYELSALADRSNAFAELRKNRRRENSRFAEALLADYYHATGNALPMYTSLRRAWPQLATVEQDSVPVYFLRMYYPLRYGDEIEEHAKKQNLDPNLVRGLILQESYYNPKARSRVGATGLMQLMPPTAKEHAKKLRIVFANSRLENPEVNVQLGTFHLRMLINLFQGNTSLAVASYNAGQGNVMKWRRAAPRKPMDEFLESIPFPETRNYVKRVTMLRGTYARITG